MDTLERDMRRDLSLRTRKAKGIKKRERNAPERALRVFNIENLFTQYENYPNQIAFLESLKKWYSEKGNLTDKQYAALKKILHANKRIT